MNLKKMMAGLLSLMIVTGAVSAAECTEENAPKRMVITLTSSAIQTAGFGLAVANALQDAGVKSTVFVASDAVDYALKSGSQPRFGGSTPREMIATLIRKGGKVMLCGGFVKMNGIETSDIVDGVAVAAPADLAAAMYAANTRAMTF